MNYPLVIFAAVVYLFLSIYLVMMNGRYFVLNVVKNLILVYYVKTLLIVNLSRVIRRYLNMSCKQFNRAE